MKKEVFNGMALLCLAASLSFLATGCSKKVVKTEEGMEPVAVEAPQTGTAESEGLGQEELLTSQPSDTGSESMILEGRTSAPMLPIYFDFDRFNVREDMRERLDTDVVYLKDNPNVHIRIEGNCDERGTNEYNMALGERRAISTKKYMMLLGVDESRMTTISYGEEKPLNYGHDELSWSQNRRADFVATR